MYAFFGTKIQKIIWPTLTIKFPRNTNRFAVRTNFCACCAFIEITKTHAQKRNTVFPSQNKAFQSEKEETELEDQCRN